MPLNFLTNCQKGREKKSKKTPKQEIIKAEEIRKYFIENVNGEK
jgi:hypothetical protein